MYTHGSVHHAQVRLAAPHTQAIRSLAVLRSRIHGRGIRVKGGVRIKVETYTWSEGSGLDSGFRFRIGSHGQSPSKWSTLSVSAIESDPDPPLTLTKPTEAVQAIVDTEAGSVTADEGYVFALLPEAAHNK